MFFLNREIKDLREMSVFKKSLKSNMVSQY